LIYLDTSVLLAQILAEDEKPPSWLWEEPRVSSRLLAYETWTRLNAHELRETHGEAARILIGQTALVEVSPSILERALEPFPAPIRTLDAMHLASIVFLKENGQRIELATYDRRMRAVATEMDIRLVQLN
jgi:predicted nucleic acid-binding protein